MFQNTKLRIIVAAVAVSLLAISIILVLNKKNTDEYTYYTTKKEQQKSIQKNDEKISEVKANEISNDKKETNNVSTQSAAEKPKETKKVLKSVKNPDVSSYTQELARVVDAALIGTWKGHFDEWESDSTDYWIYTFNSDGTYSFTHGNSKESGTYKTTHDPNNNYYHSSLILTCGKETKRILFYLSGEKLNNLVTDDKTDPTYVKQ